MRKYLRLLIVGAGCVALAACGGGGGGSFVSIPPPSPAPTPIKGSITNLTISQTFATDASTTNVALDFVSKTNGAGTSAGQTITVTYDAAAKSYTITAPDRSATFLPADVTANSNGEVR